VTLVAKTVFLIAISLIAAGFLGIGLSQITSIDFSLEENFPDFSQKSVPSEPPPQVTLEKSVPSEPSPQVTSEKSVPSEPPPQVTLEKSVPSEPPPQVTSEKTIPSEFSQRENLVIPSSSTDTN